MLFKRWNLLPSGEGIPRELIDKYSIRPLLARLLSARGITSEDRIAAMLEGSSVAMNDPMGLKDMDRAVARVRLAVERGERICVYGDYDVDGVTSTYLTVSFIRSMGGKVDFYIPHRVREGYGLCTAAIDTIAQSGIKLIVTVDTGISSVGEIAYARSLGIDTVVLDHHECGRELPQAEAVVDPHRSDCTYPCKNLAGVGVAYKFAAACSGDPEGIFRRYGDVVALGTVADAMPLVGENRTIVLNGFELLTDTSNLGLRALMEAVGVKENASVSSVSFSLAPRINAAGRMTTAYEASELLFAEDAETAAQAAERLCFLNSERQKEERRLLSSAEDMIKEDPSMLTEGGIVLCGEDWHHGTVGIVAARLAEKYSLPTVLLAGEGELVKGSARSVDGFNIFDALSRAVNGIGECGGHEMAAGVKLPRERLDQFRSAFNAIVLEELGSLERQPSVEVDLEVEPSELTLENVESLSRLEPYGTGNLAPMFGTRELHITAVDSIGEGKHTRLTLEKDGQVFTALIFRTPPQTLGFCVGERVDAVFSAEINDYRNYKSVRLVIKELCPCADAIDAETRAQADLERLCKGCFVDRPIPQRGEFAAVWKCLNAISRKDRAEVSAAELWGMTGRCTDPYGMLFILRVFSEEGLIHTDVAVGDFRRRLEIDLDGDGKKIDLENSRLVRAAKEGRK
ncbi:MAG: single-stranded-DNA-specific exonuclease RecJ [Clostridia bacterium]|nr:single-stranded-DNA-specific exonuclease RecJ [Clostridia bacterium]